MKNLLWILLVTLTHAAYSQIGAKVQQTKLHGTWQNNSSGYEMKLVLNADGSGLFDGDKIKYTAQAGSIAITIINDAETLTYSYAINGNALTVSGGDLESPIVFTRAGSTASNTASSSSQPVVTSNSIIGIWSGNNETIEFGKAGQCLYNGQAFPYQVANNIITLQTTQGNMAMPYTVNGNQLTLTINGQRFTYSKGGGNVNQSESTPVAGTGTAQELAGKWCYVNVNNYNAGASSTEQCIVLKADGTYEYYSENSRSVNTNTYGGGTNSQSSDRGTWSYDGSRLYYNSAMGFGSGSYLLEKRNHPKNNDPMIVLDGKTYVTQYQKSPWR